MSTEEVKSEMSTLRDLCIQMRTVQARVDRLEEILKTEKSELDFLRLKKIPDLMASLEVKTATFEGVGRVQLASDLYASTKEGKKQDAMQWLRDMGYEDMISETYNASTLKALFRRQMLAGIEIPSELFSVQPFIRASIVKA